MRMIKKWWLREELCTYTCACVFTVQVPCAAWGGFNCQNMSWHTAQSCSSLLSTNTADLPNNGFELSTVKHSDARPKPGLPSHPIFKMILKINIECLELMDYIIIHQYPGRLDPASLLRSFDQTIFFFNQISIIFYVHLVFHICLTYIFKDIFLKYPYLFLQDLTYLKYRQHDFFPARLSHLPSEVISHQKMIEIWKNCLSFSPDCKVFVVVLHPPTINPRNFVTDLFIVNQNATWTVMHVLCKHPPDGFSAYAKDCLSGQVFSLVGKHSCCMNNYETKAIQKDEGASRLTHGKEDEWKHALFTPTAAVIEMQEERGGRKERTKIYK